MVRKILGLIVGLPCGVLSVKLMHMLEHSIYPLPEGVSMNDMDSLAGYIPQMPFGQFVMVWLAHASGAFVSAAVCTAVVSRRWYVGALICGVFFTMAGGLNLFMLPHPVWFAIVDLLLYVPLALLGCFLVGAMFARPQRNAADAKPDPGAAAD